MNIDRLSWQSLGTGAVGLFVLVALLVALVAGFPSIVGAEESYVVVSSSMEPAIGAGDLVVVEAVDPTAVSVGDVITFRQPGADDPTTRTTHRVVDVLSEGDSLAFQTRGDANSNPDANSVPGAALIGTVSFHIPYAGYLVNFANSGTGILTLIVLPACLLIITEIKDLLSQPESGTETEQ